MAKDIIENWAFMIVLSIRATSLVCLLYFWNLARLHQVQSRLRGACDSGVAKSGHFVAKRRSDESWVNGPCKDAPVRLMPSLLH